MDSADRVELSNAWVLENRRLGLRYGRLGFIVQALLHAACIFLVAGRLAPEFCKPRLREIIVGFAVEPVRMG